MIINNENVLRTYLLISRVVLKTIHETSKISCVFTLPVQAELNRTVCWWKRLLLSDLLLLSFN
jgi:hypothetical protein